MNFQSLKSDFKKFIMSGVKTIKHRMENIMKKALKKIICFCSSAEAFTLFVTGCLSFILIAMAIA